MAKIFEKKPLDFSFEMSEMLGRFLIEPRDQPMVVYNKYLDKSIIDVRLKLDSFLGIDYPRDFNIKINEMKNGILLVLF